MYCDLRAVVRTWEERALRNATHRYATGLERDYRTSASAGPGGPRGAGRLHAGLNFSLGSVGTSRRASYLREKLFIIVRFFSRATQASIAMDKPIGQ